MKNLLPDFSKQSALKLISLTLISLLLSQPVMAGSKFKCWRNKEGVKECGTYVPPEYSQKKVETRNESGRVIEVEERAKNAEEIAEEARQAELKKIEDAKIAEQKRKDTILLKTFSRERDIDMLRDSKVNVIEGIITVTLANNKALGKKLAKLHKQAANIERTGKKPTETLLDEIKTIENRIQQNEESIKEKRAEQEDIRQTFAADMQRFRELKQPATQTTDTKQKP